MFGLFKRKKIQPWETDFLIAVLSKIPDKACQEYVSVVKSGIITGVRLNLSDIPNYVSFNYERIAYKTIYDPLGRNCKISNIRVLDSLTNTFIKVSLYFSYGMIDGYSVDENLSKYKFDPKEIDVSAIKKEYLEENTHILKNLTKEEKVLINRSEIYVTTLDNKDYYHIKELDDGDFIALDEDNNIYKITHDPFEITLLKRETLIEVLANVTS